MDGVFRASEEKAQARCSASCENFDDAGAEKTFKPGEDGCLISIDPLSWPELDLSHSGLRRASLTALAPGR